MGALVLLAVLAGCAPEGGTVTESYLNSDGKNWTVCAEKDGKESCSVLISITDGPHCQPGEIYPGCLS
jgi:hypothetical protein